MSAPPAAAVAPAALVNDALSAAVERARDSLLRIVTGHHGVGSGVAWAPGLIVTNAHVAERGGLSIVA